MNEKEQRGGPHMHPLIHGQHGGDHDAEGRGAAAVQVPHQSDDGSDHGHADDAVPHRFHQLADDHIEHTRIGHYAEIQNGKNEQSSGGAGARKARLDHGRQVVKRIMPRNHQNKAQNGREDDEGNGGLGLAAKQSHHDGDDGDKAQNTDDKVTHENVSFCFSGLCFRAGTETFPCSFPNCRITDPGDNIQA